MPYKDYTGQKFGSLTALKYLPHYKDNKTYYKCLCDCGNMITVSAHRMIHGSKAAQSCGCQKKQQIKDINIIGKTFGYLTVLEDIPNYKRGETYCRCICECGEETIVRKYGLLNGENTYCGMNCKIKSKQKEVNHCGERFGKLVCIERIANYMNRDHTHYKCRCDCGNEIIVNSSELTAGKKTHCGCSYPKRIHPRQRIDLTGQKFNRLTVKKMLFDYEGTNKTYCLCECECGTQVKVLACSLKNGSTQSCGCLQSDIRGDMYIDITGQKFGLLTVLKLSNYKPKPNQQQGKYWDCICECGKQVTVSSRCLRNGDTQTCGGRHYSSGERFIESILDKNGFSYEREYVYEDCIYEKHLRFDFHLLINNKEICIEYQGIQHYQPVKKWGGEEGLQLRKKRDQIKQQYCEEHGIALILIPYNRSKEQIENKLINILNLVTTTVA